LYQAVWVGLGIGSSCRAGFSQEIKSLDIIYSEITEPVNAELMKKVHRSGENSVKDIKISQVCKKELYGALH